MRAGSELWWHWKPDWNPSQRPMGVKLARNYLSKYFRNERLAEGGAQVSYLDLNQVFFFFPILW